MCVCVCVFSINFCIIYYLSLSHSIFKYQINESHLTHFIYQIPAVFLYILFFVFYYYSISLTSSSFVSIFIFIFITIFFLVSFSKIHPTIKPFLFLRNHFNSVEKWLIQNSSQVTTLRKEFG